MQFLVNIAAWIAALATVLWQRILLPLITHYTPEFLELFRERPRVAPVLALAPAISTPVAAEPEPINQPIPITRTRRRRKS